MARLAMALGAAALTSLVASTGVAQEAQPLIEQVTAAAPRLKLEVDGGGQLVPTLRVAFLLMGLSVLPALLVSVTSFTRIVIVMGFLRQALGTQGLPPNQVILGLSLFICLFTMAPTFAEVKRQALDPYNAGQMTDAQALEAAMLPMRQFMARHTRPQDLGLFLSMTQEARPKNFEEVPTLVLVPAFMLSELRTAFIMGALIYIPFVIIDMVVASVLMAMGMMMVPPVMIALPIKLLLFVLADGWNLVIGSLARSIMGG